MMDEDCNSTVSRKTNQNTFSWSSTASSMTMHSSNLSILEDIQERIHLPHDFDEFTATKKQQCISESICRSCSHGDLNTIQQLVNDMRTRDLVDLDLYDNEENKTTPLIYASYFNQISVVEYLLQLGVQVDLCDSLGWSALMWATLNGYNDIIQLLIEHHASLDIKSNSGKSIYDFIDSHHVFSSPVTPSTKKRHSLIPAVNTTSNAFRWDKCLPDQMFVVAEEEIDGLLDKIISEFKLPMKSRLEIYVPANIIFLSSRYAHYYTSRDILNKILSKSVELIETVIKKNTNDIHILSLWISNLTQLLYYLKRDLNIVVVTAEYQLLISELISESYALLILDSIKRLNQILEPSICEYESILNMTTTNVEFIDQYAISTSRFFHKNRFNRKSLPLTLIDTSLSPSSMTSLLSSILYVLKSYHVHPVIVIQAISQLFHFISCEIFNRILTQKKFLCRSKALQIRMNLTMVEEWVRQQQQELPTQLFNSYFNPLIQLIQFLQCVSQLDDLMDFINITKTFDLLNPMQIKRVVLNYRYEVGEAKLPDEIEKYTMQIAEDTIRTAEFGETPSSRPSSVSSLGSLFQSISKSNNHRLSIQSIESVHDDMMLGETRDSKYMLPFSLPTTTNMISSGWGVDTKLQTATENASLADKYYLELKNKLSVERDFRQREKSIVPTIPEEWLEVI